jgi:low affinity Fe/Cu permease
MESKLPGCTVVILYYGSSSYDTAQMSALIDSLVQDAQALGIETRSPNEIQALLDEYGCVEGVS